MRSCPATGVVGEPIIHGVGLFSVGGLRSTRWEVNLGGSCDSIGAVAQLGERRVRNAEVEGSSPFRSIMATIDEVRNAMHRQPFRGFTVRLPAWRSFHLKHPDFMSVPETPHGWDLDSTRQSLSA